jgi:hypothetical protein
MRARPLLRFLRFLRLLPAGGRLLNPESQKPPRRASRRIGFSQDPLGRRLLWILQLLHSPGFVCCRKRRPLNSDSNMGRRPFREHSAASRETVGDFAAQIGRLLRARLPEERPALILSSDARQPWENFYNRVEAMLASPSWRYRPVGGACLPAPATATAVLMLAAWRPENSIRLPR